MSIERQMVTLAAVTGKRVMGLEEKIIRFIREIRFYRYSGHVVFKINTECLKKKKGLKTRVRIQDLMKDDSKSS